MRRGPARRKKRNYKAEYQRRIARGKAQGLSKSQSRGHPRKGEKAASSLFERVKQKTREDAKHVFGTVPKRNDEHPDAFTYEEFLIDKRKREGRFDWTDEGAFVQAITALGLTANEAYTLWFSS